MEMPSSVTARAERNEILFNIISQPAAGAEVVDLKPARTAPFFEQLGANEHCSDDTAGFAISNGAAEPKLRSKKAVQPGYTDDGRAGVVSHRCPAPIHLFTHGGRFDSTHKIV